MKLTNIELYENALLKIEQYGSPDWEIADFRLRYEEARYEWLKDKSKDFEVVALNRSVLLPFIRSSERGATKIVRYDSLQDNVFTVTSLTGIFDFSCKGKTNSYTLPIVPTRVDANFTVDPYATPTDAFPAYIEQNNGDGNGAFIQILSNQIPRGVVLQYIKEPERYDPVNDPAGFTEEDRPAQNDILDIAIKKYELSSENYNRFNAMSEEILNSNKH